MAVDLANYVTQQKQMYLKMRNLLVLVSLVRIASLVTKLLHVVRVNGLVNVFKISLSVLVTWLTLK
jgi:hypothetical protein